MRKQTRNEYEPISEEDRKILDDRTLSPEVACIMVDSVPSKIQSYRQRMQRRPALRKASAKFRAKMKQENNRRFQRGRKRTKYSHYKFWTEEEINYIINSTDSDQQMSEKLGRTIYSIQRKRSREIAKMEENNES